MSIPNFFRTFGRFGTEIISRAEDVQAIDWLEVAKSIRWLWTAANPAVFNLVVVENPLGADDDTTYTTVASGYISLRPGRRNVRCYGRFESGSMRFRFIPVFGTGGGAQTTTPVARVPADGEGGFAQALTTLQRGGRYRVEVQLQAHGAADPAKLWQARVLGLQQTTYTSAGDYVRVSTQMLAEGFPLSTSLLQQWAKNLNELSKTHLHSVTVPIAAARPLLLHGNPHRLTTSPICYVGDDEQGEVTVAYRWTCVDAEVRVYAAILTDQGATPLGNPNIHAPGTSGDSEISVEVPLALRLASPRAQGWPVVLVSESAQDDAGAVTVSANLADDIAPRWVSTVADPGLDPDKVYRVAYEAAGGVDGDSLPEARLVLGDTATGGAHYGFVWPPYSEADSFWNRDVYVGKLGLKYTPIGHLRIEAIEVRGTRWIGGEIQTINLAGGQRLSARWLRGLPARAEQLWRRRVPLMGSSSLMGPGAFDPQVLPVGRARRYPPAVEDNAYHTFAQAVVGPAIEARTIADQQRWRDVYEAHGWLVVWSRRAPERDRELTVRLVISDVDGGGVLRESEPQVIQTVNWATSGADNNANATNVGAMLGGWLTPQTGGLLELVPHKASSLLPWDAVRRGPRQARLVPFSLVVKEDNAERATVERLATLEIKGPSGEGPYYDEAATWMQLVGWAVGVQRQSMR